MALRVRRADVPEGRGVDARFAAWGLRPRSWTNTPGSRFEWHDHQEHKVLYCVGGSITFHGRDGLDIELHPGDRLDVEADTEHSATVGPDGVECTEAFAPRPPEDSS
ncbi:MAG: cupin domain-containing protein [Actinomycetota bacterium]